MKSKKNFRISFVVSVIFLFFITIISSFIFIISLKPVKINFLNYFDRESKIFKKLKVEEIGDVFLSFNKVTKNFELLIEDVVYENSHFPSILIGFDLIFEKNFLDMSLKVFDGDIEIVIPGEFKYSENDIPMFSNFYSNFNFLKRFSDIQIVNTKLRLSIDNEKIKNYSIDFNSKNDDFFFSLSENDSINNFLSMNLVNKDEKKKIILESNRFNFDFIKYFNNSKSLSFQNLYLTGSSKFQINNDGSLDQMAFNVNLDGNLNYETYNGSELIYFDDSKVFGEINNDNLDIILDLKHFDSKIKLVFRLNFKEQRLSQILLDLDKIRVEQLLKMWPKGFKESVYFWMKNNSSGEISNLLLSSNVYKNNDKLLSENLKGKFDFSGTKIKYMDSMPIIENINGNAKIKNDKIIFSILSGESNNLKINSGTVRLYNLDSDFEKANIDLEIFSSNQNVVNYLSMSPINEKNYSKLLNINGDNTVNLNLRFPLLVDLLAEEIEYSSDVLIENSVFLDVFNNYNLDNFNLRIKISNSLISYEGSGELFGSLAEFKGEQSIKNNEFIDEINGTYVLKPFFKDYFFPESDMIPNGDIKISFTILENDQGLSKIEGIGNLEDFSLISAFLGPDLDFKDGKLRFLIRPYDNSFSGFADMKTNNLKIEINSLFTANKLLETDIQTFKSPIQDFKLKYYGDENKLIFEGKKLSLQSIDFFDDNKFNTQDFELNVELENLSVGGMSFQNPQINAKKSQNSFEEMFVSLIGENDFYKLSILDSEIGKEFVLESNYIPGLLNILDLDFNINQGSIKIEGVKKKNSQKYEGVIAGKNIVFFDAPFLANFFSIFSLDGFTQKLKDGGIIFNNFNAKYKLENSKLKIVDSLLKGSELGIQFDSVVGLSDDYFLLNGSIIPAYTINTLITKFPIVGDIVTAGSPEDGLIGAKFKVEKINGEYEVFYNPISVFVPNIIKNFLGD